MSTDWSAESEGSPKGLVEVKVALTAVNVPCRLLLKYQRRTAVVCGGMSPIFTERAACEQLSMPRTTPLMLKVTRIPFPLEVIFGSRDFMCTFRAVPAPVL
jgi:hypothetical protein